MAKCIECKGDFNRATSTDKLRCPSCFEAETQPDWKKKLKTKREKLKK